jgi:NAD(P)-dependent dehydrogenase (short-subunit alcohol dehydrogenase family)
MKTILTKSTYFKIFFPILSLAELTTFIVVPWILLFTQTSNEESSFEMAYFIASHLFIVQTQICLEPILMSDDRRGATFRFIVVTNIYRGIGLATLIIRYLEVRSNVPRPSWTRFLDIYVVMAWIVWLAANIVIAFVWWPCLSTITTASESGLRTYDDAVVIITGAASGIGRALAKAIVDRGAKHVVLVDRQRDKAEALAAELMKRGADVVVHKVDVRNFDELKNVVSGTKEKFGRIDYMFNNAGILIIGPIETIGVQKFNEIFDVNVKGVHHGIQAVYPIMKEQGFGHIVNSSSLLGLIPGGQWAVAYSASKHALMGLTTNLRIEAAKYGINVSIFCPGTIDTPIHTGGEYGANLTGIPKEIWDKQIAKMKAMDANQCAAETLNAVAKNKAIIIVPERPMMGSRLLYRLSPSLWLDRATAAVDWRRSLQDQVAATKSRKKAE